MDSQRARQLMDRYGIITSREQLIERFANDGHDIDSLFVDAMANAEWNTFGNETRQSIRNAYIERRRSLRMSAPRFDSRDYEGIIGIGRNSSPSGIVVSAHGNILWTIKHKVATALAGRRIRYPVVIDMNNRIDTTARQVGSVPHIRIMSNADSTNGVAFNSCLFNGAISYFAQVATSERVVELENAGWEIVRNENDDPIFAHVPESVDPETLQVYVFACGSYSYNEFAKIIAEIFRYMEDRWASRPLDNVAPEIESDARDLDELTSRVRSANSEYAHLADRITNSRARIEELELQLTQNYREIREANEVLERSADFVRDKVVETIEALDRLPEVVSQMRPVRRAWVEDGKFKLETHYFGLRNGSRGYLIKPIIYELDTSKASYHLGIKVTQDSRYVSPGGVIHPHLSRIYQGYGSPCWGNAGRRLLPEAWSRFDFVSVVRTLLSWQTQYNSASPMVRWNDCDLQSTNLSGWQVDYVEDNATDIGAENEVVSAEDLAPLPF